MDVNVPYGFCEHCAAPLKSYQQRYCSRTCYGAAQHVENTANTVCAWCGTAFYKPEAWKRKNKQHYCSNACLYKGRADRMKGQRQPQLDASPPTPEKRKAAARRGAANGSWKGGATLRKRKGLYTFSIKYVRCPEEYISMARKDGYVMEHRLIMAQSIGRPLLRTEVVHHINHDPTDNRLENLQLFANNAEHKRHEGETGYFKEYYRRNHTNRHTD